MTKCKKNTLMEIAYQGILQKIMQEQFISGVPLREDQLATELGVSTTPLREAFRRLEYEGWLQSSPFRGVFIRKFTAKDIADLYIMREAMESAAAAEAAQNANEKDIEKLYNIIKPDPQYFQEPVPCLAADKKSVRIERELLFHEAVAEASHNELLRQRINMLKAQTTYLWLNNKTVDNINLKNVRKSWEEHWMIYITIKRHWVEQAKSLMAKHINAARERHLLILQETSEDL